MNEKPKAIDVGAWDQLLEGMKDTAKIGKRYYDAQVEAGFTDAQAIKLTIGFLNRLMFGETQQ